MITEESVFGLGSEFTAETFELGCGSCLLCIGGLSKAQWCVPFDRADVV